MHWPLSMVSSVCYACLAIINIKEWIMFLSYEIQSLETFVFAEHEFFDYVGQAIHLYQWDGKHLK